ncbi:armadillo repeat-containing protein 8 [Holotrichia oblita]|uniref:Armadillo repeat-containing protein 8 n=1 Tax=Holotrichia oblita TaxID=644536 RepID=A0ACB9TXF7_HOLOL|nr:armadillo repeat-containing protein 8 [Holotrichia oblita]
MTLLFQNVESSRCYMDDLYSPDPDKCLASIVCIKNSVIGSNRQKQSIIAQGIVPRLTTLLRDKNMKLDVRYEAAVTMGSLAKGTTEHIDVLISNGIPDVLLDILDENNERLIDACLCCLRTLTQQSVRVNFTGKHIEKLLSYAGLEQNLSRQACIAHTLSALCRGLPEQNLLCSVGTQQVLATLLSIENSAVRLPTLTCLAAMCFENRNVAVEVVNTMFRNVESPNIFVSLLARDRSIETLLETAKCLTNMCRSGALAPNDSMIVYRAMPTLVRVCQPDHLEIHRAAAANTLAYLTEVDSSLQQLAALSNQLINALNDLLSFPNAPTKIAAFTAFASIGANDEDIRKRIIETHRLIEKVLEGLADQDEGVRLAAVRCLHSLSRSVQQLRTTFQDHTIWRPLMSLLSGNPPTELLIAASSALCNLLLEFSPSKEPILQQGVVQLLATLTAKSEPALRLNGVWALMNMTFQTDQRLKSQILTALGTDQIFRLLADSDVRVLMKTLGLLRNLVSPRNHTDTMMALHGSQVMQAVVLVLEGPHSPEVKEQALCILGNIADGERSKDHIMANEDVLKKLTDYMTHSDSSLQTAAIFCISNLVRRDEPGYAERQARLRDMGVLTILHQLVSTVSDNLLYDK